MSHLRHLSVCLIVALIFAAGVQADEPNDAPAFERPSYQTLRYNEDWSGLAGLDRSQTGDFFDPIKYVPLTEDGWLWASFGGQARLRAEGWNNFNFGGAMPPDRNDDIFLLTRLRLHGDLHVGEHVRIFVEGKSAFSTERELVGGRRTLDVDELALQNAFVDLMLPMGDEASLTLRGGRQELLFGRQRLVSPLDWANTRRTFDGFSAIAKLHDWTVTGFWTQLVEVRKYDFNKGDAQTQFFGLYAAGRVPQTDIGLDLYWLGLDRDDPVTFGPASGSETRHTLGGRLHGKVADTGLDYELEGAYQLGDVGSADVAAFIVASQLGYTFADCPLSPRVFVGFDYASGGGSASRVNTFNQLFPLGHAYLGYVDVVGRQNIIAAHVGMTVVPAPRWSVELTGHAFWRADRNDALYNAGGAPLRAGTLSDAREVGSEIDLLVRHQFCRHLQWQIGYSRFFTGRFIEQSGSASDIDFVYTALEFTF